jgi:hypothetical protein
MGMPHAMSNYGPTLGYFPNHHSQPIPQQHSAYPPQYHQRIPVNHEPDMYPPHHGDFGLSYDSYAQEREGGRNGEYQQYAYGGPSQETHRYAPRPSAYHEEVRYAQQPREQLMYGPPPAGRQRGQPNQYSGHLRNSVIPLTLLGYFPPTDYIDSGFASNFDQSMRLHGTGGGDL